MTLDPATETKGVPPNDGLSTLSRLTAEASE